MRIVMIGTGTFAEPTFEALIEAFRTDVVGLITQPERDPGNKRGSTRQTGKGMVGIAQSAIVPFGQPENINSHDGLAQLRNMQPDLLVIAAYGQILSNEALSIPLLGAINVHASLLPKYRGAAPVAYAILNGETKTGVTVIRVTPRIDSGEILLQESIDIRPDDTTGSLEARLAAIGAKLAVQALKKYEAGESMVGVKQNAALATKAPKIKKEQGLIDWTQSADAICRHVRAMQPWPTAYTYLHRPGKETMRIIVNRATRGESDCFGNRYDVGEIVTCAGLIGVCTGKHQVVIVEELLPAGRKKMSSDEFLRGYPIVEGMRFGPEGPP
jgi:methionyl-tRNA formyltransferase